MKIRAAQKSDLKECEKIFHIPEMKESDGEYLDAKFLSYYLDKKYFLVAEEDNTIIGAIFGEPLKGKGIIVWDFVVKKKYRGNGIGKALLAKIEHNAKQDGLEWIMLYSTNNKQTLEFYTNSHYNKGTKYVEFLKNIKRLGHFRSYFDRIE